MEITTEQRERSVAVLSEMLQRLGLDAQIEHTANDQEVVLRLKTSEPGRIIGRKGQYLENLELLLNRLLRTRGEPFPRVSLDVDGYQRQPRERSEHGDRPDRGDRRGGDRRDRGDRGDRDGEERLRQQALDAAKEVKRWGDPVSMGPLTARDRRVIHTALRDDPEVETESGPDEGRGMKKVVVHVRTATGPKPPVEAEPAE